MSADEIQSLANEAAEILAHAQSVVGSAIELGRLVKTFGERLSHLRDRLKPHGVQVPEFPAPAAKAEASGQSASRPKPEAGPEPAAAAEPGK